MKLILSTGNVSGEGSASMGRPSAQKSNSELVNSLRANFSAAVEQSNASLPIAVDGLAPSQSDYTRWTSVADHGQTLFVPAKGFGHTALQEEREQYDITVKLFLTSRVPVEARRAEIRTALTLVLEELGMPSIDLLIVSFAGIYFDEETEDCPEKIRSRGPSDGEPESTDIQLATWQTLEQLHDEGIVARLGVSEFGVERLEPFLHQVRVRPSVDQINLRDCCSLPKMLMTLAKSNDIELLVHNDCSNILPQGTIRALLGSRDDGAAVLSDQAAVSDGTTNSKSSALSGEVHPQWVIKYTAVVKDRGVVENKGYFATATVGG